MTALTRRHFIAGGLAAGALGLAGLTGCAPAAEKSGEDVSASAGADGAATPAAGERPWEIAPAPIAEDQITETVESDVVIKIGRASCRERV